MTDLPSDHRPTIEALVRSATARISPLTDSGDASSSHGTGFFVTRNRLFTCAHVVSGASRARVFLDGGGVLMATVDVVFSDGAEVFPDLRTRFPDLAVLSVDGYEHPSWAMLSSNMVVPDDNLHTSGFPSVGGSTRNLIATAFKVAGRAGPDNAAFLKAQGGGISPGNSGGPVYGGSSQKPMAVVGWMVATTGDAHYVVPWSSLGTVLRDHPTLRLVAEHNPPEGARKDLWDVALSPVSSLNERKHTEQRLIRGLKRGLREISAKDDSLHVTPNIPQRLLSRAERGAHRDDESVLAVLDFSGLWPSYSYIVFTTRGMRYCTRDLVTPVEVYVAYPDMRSNVFAARHETRFVFAGQASYTEDRVHLSGRGPAKGLLTGSGSGFVIAAHINAVQKMVDEVLG